MKTYCLLLRPKVRVTQCEVVYWLLTYLLAYLLTCWPTYLLTYSLTYLLTPCSTVRLEKLTRSQLVKKFSAFYGTRKFITAFAIARHLSLSWGSSIQSIHPHFTSWWSILILSIYAWVFKLVSFPQISPPKSCICLSSPPYVLHVPPISFFSILSPEQYWVRSKIIKLLNV